MQKIVIYFALILANHIFSQEIHDVVFKNCHVVSMETSQVLQNQNIAIQNGIIVKIENTKKSKLKGKKEIDLDGKYIMPSLADAHVHLPEKEEDLERFLELNLVNGVTKVRSMRGEWEHVTWKKKYDNKDSHLPKMYLTAPPIYRNMEATNEEWEGFVKGCKNNGFEMIKILSIKSQETFKILDSLSKKYQMPLGGHFPRLASGNHLSEEVFFNSNYNSIEHLGGLTGAPNFLDTRIKSIKKKNMFICPTLSWYSIGSGQYSIEELPKLPGMEYIKSETMNEWLEKTKKYKAKMGDKAYKEEVIKELQDLEEKYTVIARLQKEGIKMLLSPDASSKYMIAGFNMITEMELLKNAQLSNFEILQMATSNFAEFFKGNYGVLSVGKDADFIVLEKNPLEELSTLTDIQALYFNQKHISKSDIKEMKNKLLLASKSN